MTKPSNIPFEDIEPALREFAYLLYMFNWTFNNIEMHIDAFISDHIKSELFELSIKKYASETFHGKVELFLEYLKEQQAIYKPKFINKIDSWEQSVKELKNSRNLYIHNHWSVEPMSEKPIYLTTTNWDDGRKLEHQKFTFDEFKEMLNIAESVNLKLRELIHNYRAVYLQVVISKNKD